MLKELEQPTSQIISSESNSHQNEDIPLDPKITKIMQPLREEHLEFIASLKGPIERSMMDYFYSARKKGLFVSMKGLIDLHDSISVKASMDLEYDEKNKRVYTALRHLKKKMYPQGLIIHSELLKDPKDNKYKNYFVLLTKEEKELLDSLTHTNGNRALEDQNAEEQFLDVKEISQITEISNTVRLTQIIWLLIKDDPSIEVFRRDPKKPTKMYFRRKDVMEKIVPGVKAIQEKRKTPDSTAQELLDPEKNQEAADPKDGNALTIQVGDKRIVYSHQDWYRIKDIADAVGKSMETVRDQLHGIRENDESIKFTTLGELNRKLKLAPIGRPQTIVCDPENFIKAVIAVASIKPKQLFRKIPSEPNTHNSPASKEKKSEKPRKNSNSSFNNVRLNPEIPPKQPIRLKDTLGIKDPKQIVAVNSVSDALSHLLERTLQEITTDLKAFLEQVATQPEGDPKDGILKKILDSDSPSRLKRFFRVSLDGMLSDLWDITDTNERGLKEEKEIIEICNRLKEKGYDREKVIEEICIHFGIQIPPSPEYIAA